MKKVSKKFILKKGDYPDGEIGEWLKKHIIKEGFFPPTFKITYKVNIQIEKLK